MDDRPAAPMVELRDLQVNYGDKQALKSVSLTIQPGEIVAYLGPNGAGKSTTMQVLTGQRAPDGGSARVLGVDVASDPMQVRRRIAYVPEVAPLYDVLSAMEYLELIGHLRSLAPERVTERARSMLEALQLGEVAHRPLWTYSRGMRQRVVLASAFLHDPELVLLDEPLYGLDAQTVLLVKEIVRGLAEQGRAVVYCSHLLDVAQQLATRAVILHEGEIVADGSPAMLREGRPDASLEAIFRELTEDRDVEERAERFLSFWRAVP